MDVYLFLMYMQAAKLIHFPRLQAHSPPRSLHHGSCPAVLTSATSKTCGAAVDRGSHLCLLALLLLLLELWAHPALLDRLVE